MARREDETASAIGQILPLALGIAISPIPIIAAILMLLSPTARGSSVGFLIGWLLGIVVAVVVFILLSSLIPEKDPNASQPITGTIELVLGLLLLLLALRQWRSRPRGGDEPALPAWMGAIDSMTAARALVLGFLLAAVNPKNLLLAVAAGAVISSAGLDFGAAAGVVAIYTVVAALSVGIPIVAYLVAAEQMRAPLAALREWLVHNNATVMAVMLLIFGVQLIGKGIASF
ncbi:MULTISPECIES: GAP family protein [unclassified Leifsonia]|uniref:GAP family protein n=1 Tax=unclassified Leifsonia TaxID=2663824 RepID=UPI0014802849|nr:MULTISPECIES: GAP family protein [unclassified Leifsonia]